LSPSNELQDESYTPSLVSIRTGTHLNDLQEILKVRARNNSIIHAYIKYYVSTFMLYSKPSIIHQIDLDQPGGWNTIYLRHGSELERRHCFHSPLPSAAWLISTTTFSAAAAWIVFHYNLPSFRII
jgi:hypothetical protein